MRQPLAPYAESAQHDTDANGLPFSCFEVKPLNLWQRICEHHGVTHIVDFTAGSATLAIAACGSMNYEGIAANDAHRDWLDATLDRVVLYMAGKDPAFAQRLGGQGDFLETVSKYCAGIMVETRRLLEPDTSQDHLANKDLSDSDEESHSPVT